jgi:hypothetical protein
MCLPDCADVPAWMQQNPGQPFNAGWVAMRHEAEDCTLAGAMVLWIEQARVLLQGARAAKEENMPYRRVPIALAFIVALAAVAGCGPAAVPTPTPLPTPTMTPTPTIVSLLPGAPGQTVLPQVQTAIPQVQTAVPQVQTAVPQIATAIPQIATSVPQLATAIP